MRLSTRSRYGTRLMLDMAERYHKGAVQLKDIAHRQGISQKYLEQIMIPLKKARLVQSLRGAKGGYRLAKPPEEITAGQIVQLLEGGCMLVACAEDPGLCERSDGCVTRCLWREAAEALFEKLNSVTLSDLVARTAAI